MLGDRLRSPAAALGGESSTSAVKPGASPSGGGDADLGAESADLQLDSEREVVARYTSPLELLLASCEVVARYAAGEVSPEMSGSPGVSGMSAGVAGVARSVRPTGDTTTSDTRSGLRSAGDLTGEAEISACPTVITSGMRSGRRGDVGLALGVRRNPTRLPLDRCCIPVLSEPASNFKGEPASERQGEGGSLYS